MERCKQSIMKGYALYQCSRKAWKDGYCKQHHPDTVKVLQEESERKWREKYDTSPLTKALGAIKELQATNAALLEALKGIHNWLVCAAITTTDDMAQSFPLMEQIARAAIEREGRG